MRVIGIVLLQILVGLLMLLCLLVATCGGAVLAGPDNGGTGFAAFCLLMGGLGFIGLPMLEHVAEGQMTNRVRPYLFYDIAFSICSTCFRKLEAKIVFQGDHVLMLKNCPEHGVERVLIADDVSYYGGVVRFSLSLQKCPCDTTPP